MKDGMMQTPEPTLWISNNHNLAILREVAAVSIQKGMHKFSISTARKVSLYCAHECRIWALDAEMVLNFFNNKWSNHTASLGPHGSAQDFEECTSTFI